MEARIVQRRINLDLANRTVSTFVATVAGSPQGKKAAYKAKKLIKDYLKGLTDG